MILKPGEKVHVVIRRGFEEDIRRHFIGAVTNASDSVARVRGFAFILNNVTNQYLRQPEVRERIVSLVDANIIVHVLSTDADIERAKYLKDKNGNLCVTDGKSFSLDINEFGTSR